MFYCILICLFDKTMIFEVLYFCLIHLFPDWWKESASLVTCLLGGSNENLGLLGGDRRNGQGNPD